MMRWGLPAALLGMLLVPEALLLGRAVRDSTIQRDFAAYYLAAARLNAGGSPYGPGSLDSLPPDHRPPQQEQYLYPPALAIALRPLARLPYRTAARLWFILSSAALAAAVVLLSWRVGLRGRRLAAALVFATLLPPSEITLTLGQVNAFVLLLATGACLALTSRSRRGDVLAGVLIATAAAIKVYPVVLSVLFLRPRRSIAMVSLGLAFAAWILLMSAGAGAGAIAEWTAAVQAVQDRSAGAAPNDQSIHAVVNRLTTPHVFAALSLGGRASLVRVAPAFAAEETGRRAARLGALLLVVVTCIVVVWGRRSASVRVDVLERGGVVLAATFAALPLSWDHYLIGLILPSILLWRLSARSAAVRTCLVVAWLAVAVHRYWRVLLLAGSPWLLAFGFCGTMIVWSVLVARLAKRRPRRLAVARSHVAAET